jgi:hypothetical protein
MRKKLKMIEGVEERNDVWKENHLACIIQLLYAWNTPGRSRNKQLIDQSHSPFS